ncbi:MAG: hypothetical protein ACK5MJ_00705 [Alphaproteobacteria bacterium]
MKVIAAVCDFEGSTFAVVAAPYEVTSDKERAKIALGQARYLFPKTSCILMSQTEAGKIHLYGPKILHQVLQQSDLKTLPWSTYTIKEEALAKLRPMTKEEKQRIKNA